MMKRVLLTLALAGLMGCSPKVFVIDRHTVLEDEAAGEWPQFERDLMESSSQAGPTPFQKVKPSQSDERLFSVLNGENTK